MHAHTNAHMHTQTRTHRHTHTHTPPPQVSKSAFNGSTRAGVALFSIPIVGTFFCCYQSIANNSR